MCLTGLRSIYQFTTFNHHHVSFSSNITKALRFGAASQRLRFYIFPNHLVQIKSGTSSSLAKLNSLTGDCFITATLRCSKSTSAGLAVKGYIGFVGKTLVQAWRSIIRSLAAGPISVPWFAIA